MIAIFTLVGAVVALLIFLVAFFKTLYLLSAAVLSIRSDRKWLAHLLGPFAFLHKDIFDHQKFERVKKLIHWIGVLFVSLVALYFLYPWPK